MSLANHGNNEFGEGGMGPELFIESEYIIKISLDSRELYNSDLAIQ